MMNPHDAQALARVAALEAEVARLTAERDAAQRHAAQIAFRGMALVRAVISRKYFGAAYNSHMDDAAHLLEVDVMRVFAPTAVLRAQVEAAVCAALAALDEEPADVPRDR